ncbi:MAG: aminopeptidase C [Phycisphaerales bacterium]
MNAPASTATAPAPVTETNASITPERLEAWRESFEDDPKLRLAQNAVTQTAADDVALNRRIVTTTPQTFSHRLDDWEVTNQKKSGRCWMFAGLNLLRVGAMTNMNLKKFEFSQNYTLFWDKLERSNYFLEAIIETADREVDDRTVAFLLSRPLDDGGQWNMFTNIIRKHGLAPKSAMPETESSSNTRRMNSILLAKLREFARDLRDAIADGASVERARERKVDMLETIHRILCVHLGTPPASFDWSWNDDEKQYHRAGRLTPVEFAKKYVSLDIDEYVCLVHDPRPSSPFGRTFTVEYLGNVVEGGIVKYLNVDIEVMKRLTMESILEGEPVWMGCDVGKMMRRDLGVWDADLFEFDALYDTTFDLNKAGRLLYHQTLMTHAMLFTGVDVVEGTPRRWRVENSWGDESGDKGFYVMNDSWFDEYMFEIAAPKRRLPDELQAALDLDPIVLPPWDPMGSLAR